MLLGIDLDGCVANWVNGALPYFETLRRTPQMHTYDLGLPLNEFKWLVDEMVRNGDYLHLQPHYEELEVLLSWGLWHDIWYITRRRPGHDLNLTPTLQAQTRLWLKQWGFPYCHQVVFTQDKLAWCRAVGADIMIEDYHQDALKIHEFCPCYLIDRPWNQGEHPLRIQSFADIGLRGIGGGGEGKAK